MNEYRGLWERMHVIELVVHVIADSSRRFLRDLAPYEWLAPSVTSRGEGEQRIIYLHRNSDGSNG